MYYEIQNTKDKNFTKKHGKLTNKWKIKITQISTGRIWSTMIFSQFLLSDEPYFFSQDIFPGLQTRKSILNSVFQSKNQNPRWCWCLQNGLRATGANYSKPLLSKPRATDASMRVNLAPRVLLWQKYVRSYLWTHLFTVWPTAGW